MHLPALLDLTTGFSMLPAFVFPLPSCDCHHYVCSPALSLLLILNCIIDIFNETDGRLERQSKRQCVWFIVLKVQPWFAGWGGEMGQGGCSLPTPSNE
ncbi:hypothetical protein VNO77_43220 [Canavalia gladiata]|uniref:Uncharacterized protein n=1 Tax=Canavalia gladiata TaxID=3824 RepID=A0AAN9PP71_CANGL